jgi:hypothetical protein
MYTAGSAFFDVHQWMIPTTTCDYPVLAVAQDRSALLSIGDYCLSFDWGVPDEAQPWLADEFLPTGQTLRCDLSAVRQVLAATFAGGVEFGIFSFDSELCPTSVQLALAAQEEAEESAEYVIHGLGNYRRLYREQERIVAVSAAERVMLDVCVSTFQEIAVQNAILLRQPPPPRYRSFPG